MNTLTSSANVSGLNGHNSRVVLRTFEQKNPAIAGSDHRQWLHRRAAPATD
jgi:hypothetical protein